MEVSREIDFTGLISFMCLSLLTYSASFIYFISLLGHYFTSKYFVSFACIHRIYIRNCVWERLRKLSKDSISLVVCPCLPSSCYFVYALSLDRLTSLGEPY